MPAPRRSSRGRHEAPQRDDAPTGATPESRADRTGAAPRTDGARADEHASSGVGPVAPAPGTTGTGPTPPRPVFVWPESLTASVTAPGADGARTTSADAAGRSDAQLAAAADAQPAAAADAQPAAVADAEPDTVADAAPHSQGAAGTERAADLAGDPGDAPGQAVPDDGMVAVRPEPPLTRRAAREAARRAAAQGAGTQQPTSPSAVTSDPARRPDETPDGADRLSGTPWPVTDHQAAPSAHAHRAEHAGPHGRRRATTAPVGELEPGPTGSAPEQDTVGSAARRPARRGVRLARGAVAVGLALGVGALAIAPGLVEEAVEAAEQMVADEPTAAATPTGPTSAEVEQRQAAVLLAATAAQQASDATAAAVASSVSGEALTPLEAAVDELSTLVATIQASQPAISELQPSTASAALPLMSESMASAAADAAAAAADAAAAGADTASDPVDGTATSGDGTADAAAEPSASESTEPSASESTAPSASEGSTPSASESTESSASAGTDPTVAATADATAGAAEDSTPADPVAARLAAAAERVAALTAEVQVATQQSNEAAAAAAAAAEAARKEAQATSLDSYENGRIPDSALCELTFASGEMLRCDAAEALEQLAAAYQAQFGTALVITDSYRSYAAQVACRAQKGSLCATPGTSNHGNGTAVDLGGNAYTFNTAEHDWLLAHAEEYGWTLPDWARATGSKPEPWHWEYVG
jgi:LAS superfamily LD-carboxypeptidase LdcB